MSSPTDGNTPPPGVAGRRGWWTPPPPPPKSSAQLRLHCMTRQFRAAPSRGSARAPGGWRQGSRKRQAMHTRHAGVHHGHSTLPSSSSQPGGCAPVLACIIHHTNVLSVLTAVLRARRQEPGAPGARLHLAAALPRVARPFPSDCCLQHTTVSHPTTTRLCPGPLLCLIPWRTAPGQTDSANTCCSPASGALHPQHQQPAGDHDSLQAQHVAQGAPAAKERKRCKTAKACWALLGPSRGRSTGGC